MSARTPEEYAEIRRKLALTHAMARRSANHKRRHILSREEIERIGAAWERREYRKTRREDLTRRANLLNPSSAFHHLRKEVSNV